MKKRCCILLILTITYLLSSCQYHYHDLEKEYHISSKESIQADKSLVPEIDNETPYQELITKEIDIHDFIPKYCYESFYYGDTTLEEIATDFGVECLRETEAGALYSIHKVKQGGLLYVFYHNGEGTYDPDDHSTTRCIYMQKKLSSKDFVQIKEGSTIEELKKIDPVAQIWKNLYYAQLEWNEWDESWEQAYGYGTIHYLTDGILHIGLRKVAGEYKVFHSVLDEKYGMSDPRPGIGYPYNGLILEQDWVTE